MEESIRKASRAIRDAVSYKRGQRQKKIRASRSIQGMLDLQLSAHPSPVNASSSIDLSVTDSDSEDSFTQCMLKSQFLPIDKSRSAPLCVIHHSTVSSLAKSTLTDYRTQTELFNRSKIDCSNDAYLQINDPNISCSREVPEDSEPNNIENGEGRFLGRLFRNPSEPTKKTAKPNTNSCEQAIQHPPQYEINNKREDGNDIHDDAAFLALIDDTLGPLSPEEIVEHNLAIGFDFSYLFS
jgi:hypothetical protein